MDEKPSSRLPNSNSKFLPPSPGYIYMYTLGEVKAKSTGPEGPLLVLKVGRTETHQLGTRMAEEANVARKFGLTPQWCTEGASAPTETASVMAWKASFTPECPAAVGCLKVANIDNDDDGLVRSLWIQHAGAIPMRDNAALRWLMSHNPAEDLGPKKFNELARKLGATTELLVVPQYAFERVQQTARNKFAETPKEWTVHELSTTLKGSRSEQYVARVFATMRRLQVVDPGREDLVATLDPLRDLLRKIDPLFAALDEVAA